MTNAEILSALAVLVSLTATGIQLWKWNTGEQPRSAADAAGELTDTSLALLEPYRQEVKALRLEVKQLRDDNTALREKMIELEDVKDWAERLVHQVKSLGGEPVKIRIRQEKATNVIP
jgi:hypothetical protein